MLYKTTGVCCKEMNIEVADGVVKEINFSNGCPGNLKGIKALIEGMPKDQVIKTLKGITCGERPTSCPDQVALALESL